MYLYGVLQDRTTVTWQNSLRPEGLGQQVEVYSTSFCLRQKCLQSKECSLKYLLPLSLGGGGGGGGGGVRYKSRSLDPVLLVVA